jgi:hypothetical protein
MKIKLPSLRDVEVEFFPSTPPPMPARPPRYGWRLWRVHNRELVSPVTNIPQTLPPDGQFIARCDNGNQPPCADHDCGIYFWDVIDLMRAVRFFTTASTVRYAVTYGRVTGPFFPDTGFGDRNGKPLFRGMRCAAYTALVIIAHTNCQLAYEIPTVTYTDKLPDLNAIAGNYK